MLFFSACAAAPKAALIQDNPDIQDLWSGVSQAGPYQIIKHKATEQEVPEQGVPEQEIPEWVSRYLDEGIPGVEALPQYEDFYIFVGKNSGTNSDALTQWVTAFTAVQDSPPLITARVQTRFAGASTGMADREYGRYFENLVRTAADTIYTGTRKEADYWILKRFTSGTDDIYDFFVLVSIEKEALKIQLDAIFEGISENFKAPKDQMAAINHLKEIFYDGF